MIMSENRPRLNWRRVVLPSSLVLNLFLVALIGGHLVRHDVDQVDPGRPSLARALADAEARLSAPDAAAFGAVLRRDAPQYELAAQQFEQARSVLKDRIVAQPFDPVAVRQALTAWQVNWNHFIDSVGNPLIDALAQISPEGRQKLVAQRGKAQDGLRTP